MIAAVDEEQVVRREVSRYGLHTVRVLRAGRAPDRERWIRAALDAGADAERMTYLEWAEEELGVHYLQVWWRVPGEGRPYDGWIG